TRLSSRVILPVRRRRSSMAYGQRCGGCASRRKGWSSPRCARRHPWAGRTSWAASSVSRGKQERPTANPAASLCHAGLPDATSGRERLLLALRGWGMAGNRVVEVLARSELDALAGGDVDLFASLWVDANTGGGVYHREHTEPDQANRVALFESFENGFQCAIDENGALF